MRLKIPPKRVCKEFHLIYELRGAQKAIDVLAGYYGVRKMKIMVNGRKVGNKWEASYDKNVAYFTRNGLSRFNVLHEFYHHLADRNGLEMSRSIEESKANRFAREIMES